MDDCGEGGLLDTGDSLEVYFYGQDGTLVYFNSGLIRAGNVQYHARDEGGQ
jgi:hypothetical protein